MLSLPSAIGGLSGGVEARRYDLRQLTNDITYARLNRRRWPAFLLQGKEELLFSCKWTDEGSNMAGKICSRWVDYVLAKPLKRLFQNPRRVLGDYIKAGMTVLDVGCGTGYFSLGMARMVGLNGRVVCVDLQAEMIKSLKQRAAKAGLSERIDPRVCSDCSLEIDDLAGQVDFALAFHVVHHAADVPGLMTEVHRALKRGGRLLVVEPAHHALAAECEAAEAAAQQAGFAIAGHPKLRRNWAAAFVKN